jgi:ribonuclease T2
VVVGCRVLPDRSEPLQGRVQYTLSSLTISTRKQTLPTFEWLSQAGITPDSSKTLTLSTITSALKSASGVTPALDCDGNNLNQISWYFHVKGSLFDGQFVPIGKTPLYYAMLMLTIVTVDAPEKGSCASTGLKYPPKSGSSSGGGSPTTTGGSSAPTGVRLLTWFSSMFKE